MWRSSVFLVLRLLCIGLACIGLVSTGPGCTLDASQRASKKTATTPCSTERHALVRVQPLHLVTFESMLSFAFAYGPDKVRFSVHAQLLDDFRAQNSDPKASYLSTIFLPTEVDTKTTDGQPSYWNLYTERVYAVMAGVQQVFGQDAFVEHDTLAEIGQPKHTDVFLIGPTSEELMPKSGEEPTPLGSEVARDREGNPIPETYRPVDSHRASIEETIERLLHPTSRVFAFSTDIRTADRRTEDQAVDKEQRTESSDRRGDGTSGEVIKVSTAELKAPLALQIGVPGSEGLDKTLRIDSGFFWDFNVAPGPDGNYRPSALDVWGAGWAYGTKTTLPWKEPPSHDYSSGARDHAEGRVARDGAAKYTKEFKEQIAVRVEATLAKLNVVEPPN